MELMLGNPDRDLFMIGKYKAKLDSSVLYDLSRIMKMHYAKRH